MGEAKDREAALKAAQEEEREHQEELQKLLATPMSKDEAGKAMADAEVEVAQLLVTRQKFVAQANAYRSAVAEAQCQIDIIDCKLQEVSLTKSIIFRRTLNPQPQMGEPVGGKKE